MAEKLYYSIGEVAEKLGVNPSLIRFWEKEFPEIKPHKTNKGNRMFTVGDISLLESIYQLVKVEGYTLSGAREQLKSRNQIPGEKTELIQKLESIRTGLEALAKNLE